MAGNTPGACASRFAADDHLLPKAAFEATDIQDISRVGERSYQGMRTIRLFLVIILAVAALLWLGGMSLVNTGLTQLEVRVAGSVDEVSFFRTDDPTSPVAVIQTNGVDTTQVVKLPTSQYFSPFYQTPPSSYTFTFRVGESVYQGRKICCENGFFPHRSLIDISGPSDWEIIDK